MLHIAMYQPEIPPNVGNIARQCVGMGAMLHLIGPYAIDLSSKAVRRAGLDYWPHLKLQQHDTPDAFLQWLGDRQPWLVTKFGQLRYDQAAYESDDVLLFGNELRGLPDAWRERWAERCVFIPMTSNIRSYNVANTVSVLLMEASRRSGLMDQMGREGV